MLFGFLSMLAIVYIFLLAQLSQASTISSTYKTETTPELKHQIAIPSGNALPILNTIDTSNKSHVRKKKGPNSPLSLQHHQLLVQNLHVIPIQHHIHTDLNQIIGYDLTVIPLHRVDHIRYNEHDEIESSRYRNPLGGYGAGWGYGGHGAGHGFHYAYG